jgi:cyclin-dependent kinase 12/13
MMFVRWDRCECLSRLSWRSKFRASTIISWWICTVLSAERNVCRAGLLSRIVAAILDALYKAFATVLCALGQYFLSHSCLIRTTEGQNEIPKNVFMVFEYLEYDLTGILETPEIRFSQDHIKSWSQQLLAGVHYMHTNRVIHRDLKASNLLVNKAGELKIADWGLARTWNPEMERLTHKVVTLWYRSPELLLGCMEYGPKIDMWSVGCIIAEMFRRTGFLKGSNEQTQLDLIFRTMGHPTKENWPNVEKTCRLWKQFKPRAGEPILPNRLTEALKANLPNPKWMTDHALTLITQLLTLDPDVRLSAEQALDADYFFEIPIVKTPDQLSMNFSVKTVHEWECRRRYEQMMAARKATQPPPPSNAAQIRG